MRWIKINRVEGGCTLGILTPLGVAIITGLGWASYGDLGAVGGLFIGLGAILLPHLMVGSRNPRGDEG